MNFMTNQTIRRNKKYLIDYEYFNNLNMAGMGTETKSQEFPITYPYPIKESISHQNRTDSDGQYDGFIYPLRFF